MDVRPQLSRASCSNGGNQVSILVFMDVRPQPFREAIYRRDSGKFQSLFSWMSGLSIVTVMSPV